MIRATSGAVAGSASVLVTNAAPTVATPAAAMPNPITGTTTRLSVLGDDDGGEANLTYTWTVTAGPAGEAYPTFSGNGNNAAKDTTATFFQAGSYTFLVTITDTGGLSTTSSVDVTVSQSLTSITDSPSSANLNLNGIQSFSAVGYDQFGAALVVQPSFTWGIASGVGSIDGTGLYTAGSVAGTATITATSGTLGWGHITVTNAAPTVVTPAAAMPNPIIGTTTASPSSAMMTVEKRTSLIPGLSPPSLPERPTRPSAVTATTRPRTSLPPSPRPGSYTFLVTITDAGGLSTTSSVGVVVQEPEVAGIDVTPTNGLVTTSGGGLAHFTVVLTAQPTATVTIPLRSTNLEEGVIDQTSLIFTPADWEVPQSVTVTGVQDFINDGDVPYFVVGGPASSTDPRYDGLVATDVSLTNRAVLNQSPMSVVPGLQITTQNQPLVFSKNGGNAISVLDAATGPDRVQVALTVSQGVLSLRNASGLDVTAGSDGSAAVTFTDSLDDVNAALDGLLFAPPPGFVGTAWLMVEVNDPGNTRSGGARSDTEIVPITVSRPIVSVSNPVNSILSDGTVEDDPVAVVPTVQPGPCHRQPVGK